MRRALSLSIGILLIVVGAVLGLMTIAAELYSPPRYASTVRIAPGLTDPAAIATEVQKIQSRPILDQVVTNLDLTRRWGEKFKEPQLPLGICSAMLKRDLEVRPGHGTHLIEIRVVSDTPEEASEIANRISEVYRDSAFAPKSSDGKSSVQIIDKAQPNLRPARSNKVWAIGTGTVLTIIGIALVVRAFRRAKPASPL